MKLLKSGNSLINIKYIKSLILDEYFKDYSYSFDEFIKKSGKNFFIHGRVYKLSDEFDYSIFFNINLKIYYFDNINPYIIYNFQPNEAKYLIDRLDLQFNEILKIFKDEKLNQENLLAILFQETKETYQKMLVIYNEVLLKIMKISDLESEIISL